MLIFFLLCGRYLEQTMRQRTRAVAGNIAALRSPLAARINADGSIVQVPHRAARRRRLVLVRPGERMPVDGVVVSGESEVDESIVTGETAHRVDRSRRRRLFRHAEFFRRAAVRTRAVGSGSFLDEIERLLENAASARSRYVGIAERASKHLCAGRASRPRC